MQRLFFSIKRVHWMWQRRARALLVDWHAGVTPAQFNLLRTLHTYRHGIVRFKLAQLLGVAAPGVSRMVKMLEERKLVVRSRYENDRRCVCVKLTELGKDLVTDMVGEDWPPEEPIDDILEREARVWFASTEFPEVELDVLDRFLIRARARQFDRAIYPVPWHGGEVLYGEPGTIREPPAMEIVVAA